MAKVFKPDEITDPKVPFARIDGTRADFDPWEFLAALEASEDGTVNAANAIRKFLGYPTGEDEVAEIKVAAAEARKPFILTLGMCNSLQTFVMEFVAELPDTKKKLELSQKLSVMGGNRAN